jgi:hypothetical protein
LFFCEAASGDTFEIKTDDLHALALSELQLTSKGRVLTLNRTFKDGGKTKRQSNQVSYFDQFLFLLRYSFVSDIDANFFTVAITFPLCSW